MTLPITPAAQPVLELPSKVRVDAQPVRTPRDSGGGNETTFGDALRERSEQVDRPDERVTPGASEAPETEPEQRPVEGAIGEEGNGEAAADSGEPVAEGTQSSYGTAKPDDVATTTQAPAESTAKPASAADPNGSAGVRPTANDAQPVTPEAIAAPKDPRSQRGVINERIPMLSGDSRGEGSADGRALQASRGEASRVSSDSPSAATDGGAASRERAAPVDDSVNGSDTADLKSKGVETQAERVAEAVRPDRSANAQAAAAERATVEPRREGAERNAQSAETRAQADFDVPASVPQQGQERRGEGERPRDQAADARRAAAASDGRADVGVKTAGASDAPGAEPVRSEPVLRADRAEASNESRPGAQPEQVAPRAAEAPVSPAKAPTIAKGEAVSAARETPTLATPVRTDSAPAVEAQVSRGIGAALAQRGGSITLKLAPESLGHVRVSMRVERGDVTLDLEATTERAHQALSKELASLRASLESRGLRVEKAQVHLAPTSTQGSAPDANSTRAQSDEARDDRRDDQQSEQGRDGRSGQRERAHDDGRSFEHFTQDWDAETFSFGLHASA